MENLVEIIVLVAIYIPVYVMMAYMPYLTRRTESFGVSIPEKVYNSKRLVDMRRIYALQTGVVGGVILVGTVAGALFSTFIQAIEFGFVIATTIIAFIGGSFIVYLRFHFQMKQLKASENWDQDQPQRVVIDTQFRNRKMTYSNHWFWIPTAITLFTLVMTIIFYDRIPDPIPINYDFSGDVREWLDKSVLSVMFVPLLQVMMMGLFLFINVIIERAKQQIDPANPKKSIAQNQAFRKRWSAFIIISGTLLIAMFFVMQLSMIVALPAQWQLVIVLTISLGMAAGAFVLAFMTGQSGSRIPVQMHEQKEKVERDEDHHWKLGQFYYNPQDPAIFVEKRFGVGWTLNFARPAGWLFIVGTIGIIVAIPVLIQYFS